MNIDDIKQYMMGRSRLKPEMALQCALMSWLEQKHPTIRALTMVSCGGMWTSKSQASINKSMGYKRGTPDIMIAIPQNGQHGLFIELKTDKGRPSPEQKALCYDLNQQGYYAVISKGWENTIKTIENYCAQWITEKEN